MPVNFFRLLLAITVYSPQNVYYFWCNFNCTEVLIGKKIDGAWINF